MSGQLTDHLRRRIRTTGPITVADFMTEALLHPKYGYYTTGLPIGEGGDFITAPEISQMFGELIGLWLAQTWMDQGAPGRFILCELGPGRARLMRDILRATRGVRGFHDAMELHIVEASPTLATLQRQHLGDVPIHGTMADLPQGPLFLIANEFFDALPVRQAVRDGDGWRERVIGLSGGNLSFALTEPAPIAALAHLLAGTAQGEMREWHPALPAYVGEIASRVETHGGAGLIIDYGDAPTRGNSFQAVKDHAPIDPLALPGESDLTAHVDFAAVKHHAAGASTSGATPQGLFLKRLGIDARTERLARGLQGEALQQHIAAHRRLTHEDEMGTLFKAIAIYPSKVALPAGLDP